MPTAIIEITIHVDDEASSEKVLQKVDEVVSAEYPEADVSLIDVAEDEDEE